MTESETKEISSLVMQMSCGEWWGFCCVFLSFKKGLLSFFFFLGGFMFVVFLLVFVWDREGIKRFVSPF